MFLDSALLQLLLKFLKFHLNLFAVSVPLTENPIDNFTLAICMENTC